MEEEEDFPEDLICPICLHLPSDEIYQCNNGHSICAECCKSTDNCPHCRISYKEGKIRNRAMEAFIGSMKCICPYKSLGCEQVLQRKDLQSHKLTCIYNGKSIQTCKLLGLNCDFWASAVSIDTAITHFVDEHDFIIHEDCIAEINLGDFLGTTLSCDGEKLKDCMWTPVLMEYKYKATDDDEKEVSDTDDDSWSTDSDSSERELLLVTQKFAIVSRLHGEDETMSWQCIFLGESSKAALQFEFQFEIESFSDKAPNLKWIVPSVGILHGDVMTMQMSPFRVPVALLRKYYIKNEDESDLLVKLEICKNGETPSVLDETEEYESMPIFTFSIPLDNNATASASNCKVCLGASNQILFKCRTCVQQYYICGQCIETCSHPGDHSFDVVRGLDNSENCAGTLENQSVEEGREVFENGGRAIENLE